MLTATTHLPLAADDALFGRQQQLDLLGRLLVPQARNRVIVLHGPGGVGKSALVAAAAAAWREAGGDVEPVCVGELPAPTGPRRLLVAELEMTPTTAAWSRLLGGLRAEDRLLVTARGPVAVPVDDSRLIEVPVVALSWDDSVELLAREGVAPDDRPALVRWAQGIPLLLVLGAQEHLQHPAWEPGAGPDPAALADRLARRLGDGGPAAAAEAAPPSCDDAARRELRAAAEEAVRHFQSPERLARNPLARGGTATARVEHLRGLVVEAVEGAFGPSRNDRALCEVLTAGYLVAESPHETVAFELFLSRSTYFRRLSAALGRVADRLADETVPASEAPVLALVA